MYVTRVLILLMLGAALALSAAPVFAQSTADSSAQMQDANRNSEAYRDGFLHGQTDAQNGVRNDQAPGRWASTEDRTAYSQGYDAGYMHTAPAAGATSPAPTSGTAAADMRAATTGPERYGYDDGLANGRRDKAKGDKFKPTGGDMYKHADHGWSADFGDKDHYKQVYRQAYTKGYEEGYNGGVPH